MVERLTCSALGGRIIKLQAGELMYSSNAAEGGQHVCNARNIEAIKACVTDSVCFMWIRNKLCNDYLKLIHSRRQDEVADTG